MSEIPDKIIVLDIIEGIDNIMDFVSGMDFDDYSKDLKTKAAVERNLEIIGEAANRLNHQIWMDHPEIPWRRIVSLRNRLIHRYFETDDSIIWEVIGHFLIPLKEQLVDLSNNL